MHIALPANNRHDVSQFITNKEILKNRIRDSMRTLMGSEYDKVAEATLVFSGVLFRRKHLNDAPPALRLPCKMRRVLSAKEAQTL